MYACPSLAVSYDLHPDCHPAPLRLALASFEGQELAAHKPICSGVSQPGPAFSCIPCLPPDSVDCLPGSEKVGLHARALLAAKASADSRHAFARAQLQGVPHLAESCRRPTSLSAEQFVIQGCR